MLVDITAVPRLEHLLDIRIEFAPAQLVPTPLGMRVTCVIRDGRFAGAATGTVLPGGGDWVLVDADGVARLDVRATLRTDDGALIHLTNTGRAVLDDDTRHRYLAGEFIGHDACYARSSPLFDTADSRYRGLTGLHTVAINALSLTSVHYRVFAVR